jgi:hypothetical protein
LQQRLNYLRRCNDNAHSPSGEDEEGCKGLVLSHAKVDSAFYTTNGAMGLLIAQTIQMKTTAQRCVNLVRFCLLNLRKNINFFLSQNKLKHKFNIHCT